MCCRTSQGQERPPGAAGPHGGRGRPPMPAAPHRDRESCLVLQDLTGDGESRLVLQDLTGDGAQADSGPVTSFWDEGLASWPRLGTTSVLRGLPWSTDTPESTPAQRLPCTRPKPSGLDVTLGNTLTQKPAGGSGPWQGETRLQTPSRERGELRGAESGAWHWVPGPSGFSGPPGLHQGPWRRRQPAPLVANGGGTHGRHCLRPAVFVFHRDTAAGA